MKHSNALKNLVINKSVESVTRDSSEKHLESHQNYYSGKIKIKMEDDIKCLNCFKCLPSICIMNGTPGI